MDLSGSLQGAGGVGGLLAVTTTDTNSGTSTNYYPTYDANGNVTAYLDAGGKVAARYAYDAFGATAAQSGDMAESFTHRFSTKPFDAETGLVMYQLRPYEPGLGRWIGRDPIEEEGGVSLYGFVGNDPTDRSDLLGLFDKNSYTLVKSWMTFDQTMCPEFHGNGGTIEEYKKMFSNDGVTGRLKMLTVPVSLRANLANSMVIALNMKTKYYYELTMKLKMLMHLTKAVSFWIIHAWDDPNFRRRCRNSGSNSRPTPSVWSISHRADGRMALCARSVVEAGIG